MVSSEPAAPTRIGHRPVLTQDAAASAASGGRVGERQPAAPAGAEDDVRGQQRVAQRGVAVGDARAVDRRDVGDADTRPARARADALRGDVHRHRPAAGARAAARRPTSPSRVAQPLHLLAGVDASASAGAAREQRARGCTSPASSCRSAASSQVRCTRPSSSKASTARSDGDAVGRRAAARRVERARRCGSPRGGSAPSPRWSASSPPRSRHSVVATHGSRAADGLAVLARVHATERPAHLVLHRAGPVRVEDVALVQRGRDDAVHLRAVHDDGLAAGVARAARR